MKNLYKFSFLILTFLFSAITFAQDYYPGIVITNEGLFGTNTASLSFLNEEEALNNDIFGAANPGLELGNTAQGMGFNGDYAYIVLNGSESLKVVNRSTFELITTIDEGLENPRHIAFSNGKGYVTNWGDAGDTQDDYVAIINLETNSVENTISVSEGPERIIEADGKLYVSQQGGYGYGNTISVIDLSNNSVSEIEVADVPLAMVTKGGFLYVICGGKQAWTGEETEGGLFQIDLATNTISKQYDFEMGDHPNYLGAFGNQLYFVLDGGIYTINLAEETPEHDLLVQTDVAVAYGFNVIDDKIYIADAVDYVSPGEITIYSLDGVEMASHTVGLLPNGFYKNDDEGMNVIDHSLAEVKVYPNPASGVFYVNGKNISKVEIYDLAGKIVKSSSSISNGISVKELTNGIYIVKIQSGKNSISKKLIIK